MELYIHALKRDFAGACNHDAQSGEAAVAAAASSPITPSVCVKHAIEREGAEKRGKGDVSDVTQAQRDMLRARRNRDIAVLESFG